MKNAMEMTCVGLKCDNNECDFIDNTIQFEEYPKWVNKPCPKCGQNLLTEQDYFVVKSMYDLAKIINDNTPKELLEETPEKIAKLSIGLNGTGKIDLDLSIEKHD